LRVRETFPFLFACRVPFCFPCCFVACPPVSLPLRACQGFPLQACGGGGGGGWASVLTPTHPFRLLRPTPGPPREVTPGAPIAGATHRPR